MGGNPVGYIDPEGLNPATAVYGSLRTGYSIGNRLNQLLEYLVGGNLGSALYTAIHGPIVITSSDDVIDIDKKRKEREDAKAKAKEDAGIACKTDDPQGPSECELLYGSLIKEDIRIKADIRSPSPRRSEFENARNIKDRTQRWNEAAKEFNKKCVKHGFMPFTDFY